ITSNNLEECLKGDLIIKSLRNGILNELSPSIEDVMGIFVTSKRIFLSKEECAKAVFHEIIAPEHYSGSEIPKIIHHYWSGKHLSPSAMGNLFHWIAQTSKHGWRHLLWTDKEVNCLFPDDLRENQLELLSRSGIRICDIQDGCFKGEKEKAAYRLLANRISERQHTILPYLSDITRYDVLYHWGGVYVDVDINPGKVDLNASLKHRTRNDIPLLGPGFRTRDQAKATGYYGRRHGEKEKSLINSYSYQLLGNHFMATKPSNPILLDILSNTANFMLNDGEKTSGPKGMLKALIQWATSKTGKTTAQILSECIPPWVKDMEWVTLESDNLVN
ncbi:hypothetical protein LJC53_04670, partial [Bacteroidales bacterium OttesenSCG-928-C03]|nr:hypothetical protein [Bacteroidales bacterium OttesenSCG-928-C03]